MPSFDPRPSLALVPILALALGACGGGGGGGGGSGSVSGAILFVADAQPLVEVEPNGGFDAPTAVPPLVAGTRRVLSGELGGAEDAGDELDAFALLARDELRVRATVRGAAGALSLAAWDPVAGRFVATSRRVGAATTLELAARGAFDLVVRGDAGVRYAVEVRAEAVEARDASSRARRTSAAPGFEPAADVEAVHARWLAPALESRAGEFLVLPRDPAALEAELLARGLSVVDRIPGSAWLVRVAGAMPAEPVEAARATVARMRAASELESVELAELDLVRRPLGGPTPDDTFYPLQWHYPLLHLSEAWAITTGDPSVVVAVIDTGMTAHPDLVGRQVAGYDMISDPALAADGDGRDPDPTDPGDAVGLQPSSWHGTHVAGTVGAATDNGIGVAGVTWQGAVLQVRVLGAGGGTDFDLANGIRYAAGLANASGTLPAAPAKVLNLSLGGPGASSTVQSAVAAARAAGASVFAAAGNNDSSVPFYPAAFDGVVSISAVDINGDKAPYSNFHATVDLCAPGGDVSVDLDSDGYPDGVLSTLLDDATPPAFVYGFYNGTSMACPHAAGVAALMLAADPGHDLTPDEIETFLRLSAVDLGPAGHDAVFGHGLIHAGNAVALAAGAGPVGPVLGVTPASLAFGSDRGALVLQVTNLGTGTLDVTGVTATTDAGGAWLTATPGGPGNGSDVGSVSVTVDRGGLADGVYTGQIEVQSDGGTQAVPVTMEVAAVVTPVDVDLYVLAVELDSGDFATLAQDIVNPTTGLAYALAGLPAGDYLIVCGSDDDGDGFICGDGDVYCGLWPATNDPAPLPLASGADLAGIDFPVTTGVGTTAARPTRGFRVR